MVLPRTIDPPREQCSDTTFGQLADIESASRLIDPHQADAVGQQDFVTTQQRGDVVEVGGVDPANDVIQVRMPAKNDGLGRL